MSHIKVDASGNIYFADSENQRIRRIGTDGIITTVAGSGQRVPIDARCEQQGGNPVLGDNGPATAAKFYNPSDVALPADGSLLIADELDNRIRHVSNSGTITTIVGNGAHNFFAPNVPATNTPMDWPAAVAVDSAGTLYFAEIHGARIGKIVNGRTVVVAGDGFSDFKGDGSSATSARLKGPTHIAFDAAGNLYIADQQNQRIRRVTPQGIISTVAGNGTPGFSGDGGAATSASLNLPSAVAVDARGNVFIADAGNNRVRKVDTNGIITTVAGDGQAGRGPDGVPATASSLNGPTGVAVSSAGDLYIVDTQNYLIRKVSFRGEPTIASGGIVNGASFAPSPVPLAAGSIISIFGANLAPATAQASSTPLPRELSGTSVRTGGQAIPLFFVSPGQINAQLPTDLPAGDTTLTITNATGTSRAEPFSVAPASVGIFTAAGTNRALVLNQDNSVNTPQNPETRGNFIVVFLTGQGAVRNPVAAGEPASSTVLSPATLPSIARIGGVPVNIAFLGLAPGFIGLAQANIQVPASVQAGAEVTIEINVGGQTSNSPTISLR